MKFWNRPDVVEEYGKFNELVEPEKELLNMVKPDWSMLDIGVGGGRTTIHFKPKVAGYIGMDNSPLMINMCKKSFPETAFWVMDARNLHGIPDETYDFVLFSFNGIDYVPFKDRQTVLNEMYRVLKPGGLMAFSSHDIDWLKELPLKVKLKLFLLNFKPIGKNHVDYRVKEGNNFLTTTFIEGCWQLEELRKLGLKSIHARNISNGSYIYYWGTK